MGRSWQRLCAYVGQVLIGRHIDEVEGTLAVLLAHLVVVGSNVLRSVVDLVVLRDGDGTCVVTAEGTRDGHLEIGESFLNP